MLESKIEKENIIRSLKVGAVTALLGTVSACPGSNGYLGSNYLRDVCEYLAASTYYQVLHTEEDCYNARNAPGFHWLDR